MLTSANADSAFMKNEFSNRKNAMEKKKGFQMHGLSDSHMEVVYVPAPAGGIGDIGDLLSQRRAFEKSNARIEIFCSQSCPTSDT